MFMFTGLFTRLCDRLHDCVTDYARPGWERMDAALQPDYHFKQFIRR